MQRLSSPRLSLSLGASGLETAIAIMSGKVPKRNPRPGVDEYGRQPLHYAASRGDLAEAESLLEAGADPSFADDNGYTPLHFAAQERHAAMVSLLLVHHANPNAADAHGNHPLWTALMHARGQQECARLLLQAGADRHHRNKAGRSPDDLAQTLEHGWEMLFAGDPHRDGPEA